jgi:hypothetical protein
MQGVMTPMYWIARNNELGAAICDHLRKGNWLLDWITARLRQRPASAKVRVIIGDARTLWADKAKSFGTMHPFYHSICGLHSCANFKVGSCAIRTLNPLLRAPRQLADWLDAQFAALKKLPRYLIPCYFAPVVYAAYTACTRRVLAQLDPSVGRSDAFIQACRVRRWKPGSLFSRC